MVVGVWAEVAVPRAKVARIKTAKDREEVNEDDLMSNMKKALPRVTASLKSQYARTAGNRTHASKLHFG
jgi:hypothetical protein